MSPIRNEPNCTWILTTWTGFRFCVGEENPTAAKNTTGRGTRRSAAWRDATPRMPRYPVPCHVTFCALRRCCGMICYYTLWYVNHLMSCHSMLCNVVSSYGMRLHTMLCYATHRGMQCPRGATTFAALAATPATAQLAKPLPIVVSTLK